jgi:hypothetical protein
VGSGGKDKNPALEVARKFVHTQIVVGIRVGLCERECRFVRVMITYELIKRIGRMKKRYWSLRQCVERRPLMGASSVLLCDLTMKDDESFIN